MAEKRHDHEHDENRDPLSGEPGAHPVGTGLGAAAAGAAAMGAAAGLGAGPVGAAIGAAVGAVAGGLAGKGIAEQIDPTWIVKDARVGVTAGASAPEILVEGVITRLKALGASAVSPLAGIEENVTFPLPKDLQG